MLMVKAMDRITIPATSPILTPLESESGLFSAPMVVAVGVVTSPVSVSGFAAMVVDVVVVAVVIIETVVNTRLLHHDICTRLYCINNEFAKGTTC